MSQIISNTHISLSDTRLRLKELKLVETAFKKRGFLFFGTSSMNENLPKKAEVAIVIKSSNVLKIQKKLVHMQNGFGRCIGLIYDDVELGNNTLIASAYVDVHNKIASTVEILAFLNDIKSKYQIGRTIIMGDFNVNIEFWASRSACNIKDFLQINNLVDTHRFIYPNKMHHKGHTFPSKSNTCSLRIDYIFMNKSLLIKNRPTFNIIP